MYKGIIHVIQHNIYYMLIRIFPNTKDEVETVPVIYMESFWQTQI